VWVVRPNESVPVHWLRRYGGSGMPEQTALHSCSGRSFLIAGPFVTLESQYTA
jgi:hypothetical protein